MALTIASSLLIIAAFPPHDLGFTAWFGLAPFLYALRLGDYLSAILLGFLFGVLHLCGTLAWSLDIATIRFHNFCICIFLLSLFSLVFGGLYRLIGMKSGTWSIVGVPSLWVALEYARSNLSFLAFPWNLMGHSQHQNLAVLQIADVTGVYGVSFLLVAANEFLSRLPGLAPLRRAGMDAAAGWEREGTRWAFPATCVCTLLALTFLYGWFRLSSTFGDRWIRVAMVQANAVVWDNMSFQEQVKHYRVYETLTRQATARKPDLIVWPSSSIAGPISERFTQYTVSRLARTSGTYLLVGGAGHRKDRPRREGDPVYSNSEFLFSPSGRLEGQFNKIRLLPFHEYLPMRGAFPWPAFLTTLRGDFIAGTEYTIFSLPAARFSTPICWENLFPDTFRRFVRDGAQFMVAVTNEAFFGGKERSPYRQSLAMYACRAVENRVAVARAASTGITAFIYPNGEVVDKVEDDGGKDWNVAGILVRDIPLATEKTFYTVHGDLFAYLAILTTAILLPSVAWRGRDLSDGEDRVRC